MADLNYKFTGVNKQQLANEIRHLRENSSTFRELEAAALAAGYTTVEIEMGAGLLSDNIADSTRINSTTRRIRINSDVTASWGVGGRQAAVGEIIAHELAHAVIPTEYRQPGVIDFQENGSEGKWVRQQAGQVARDLRLPGPNNADFQATRIPVNEVQGCTEQRPQGDGARDGVLFLDGSRGFHGKGQTVQRRSNFEDVPRSKRLVAAPAVEDIPASEAGPGPHPELPSNFQVAALNDYRGPMIVRPARSGWPEEAGDTFGPPRYVVASTAASDQPNRSISAVLPDAGADPQAAPVRYLSSRMAGKLVPSGSGTGDIAPPLAPLGGKFDPRQTGIGHHFGSSAASDPAFLPRGLSQPEPLVGLVSGEPMSFHPVQPMIWDFPERSAPGANADDWLERLLERIRSA